VKATIPVNAALTLVPVCAGVAIVSYFDTAPKSGSTEKATDPIGVIFAFAALFTSAIYTVWIDKYHRVLECTSMQLLLNQAPVSVLVMLFVIPFSDDITVWVSLDSFTWMLVLLVSSCQTLVICVKLLTKRQQSGFLACLINLSQFLIISEAGPVSSTVVGHSKTCLIIAAGWFHSGKSLSDGSLGGIFMALGGIIA
jgi:solute carrier family 35 protein E3